jgi:hypothetical protein
VKLGGGVRKLPIPGHPTFPGGPKKPNPGLENTPHGNPKGEKAIPNGKGNAEKKPHAVVKGKNAVPKNHNAVKTDVSGIEPALPVSAPVPPPVMPSPAALPSPFILGDTPVEDPEDLILSEILAQKQKLDDQIAALLALKKGQK